MPHAEPERSERESTVEIGVRDLSVRLVHRLLVVLVSRSARERLAVAPFALAACAVAGSVYSPGC